MALPPKLLYAGVGMLATAFFASMNLTAFETKATHSGTVQRVIDGDTVDVRIQGRTQRVRLAFIDAPERRQNWGSQSQQALAAMVQGAQIRITEHGTDRYGRIIGELTATECQSNGQCNDLAVNVAMVARGHAWAYRQFSPGRQYLEAEDGARTARIGLWSSADPTPPWTYRRAK